MAATDTDAWFHDAVIDGMTALQTLGLPGSPPAETVTLTAEVWITALWSARTWRQATDAGRLAAAFVALAAKVDRWPAPRALLDELPPVVDQVALPPPTPRAKPEVLASLRATAQRLREQMLLKPAPRGYAAQTINEALRAEQDEKEADRAD